MSSLAAPLEQSLTVMDPVTGYEFPYLPFLAHTVRPVVEIDSHGFIRSANSAFCELTGVSEEQLVGIAADRLFAEKDGENGSDEVRYEVRCAGGSTVGVTALNARILDGRGHTVSWLRICGGHR